MNKFNIFRASIKKPSDMDKSYQDVDDLSSVGDETAIDDFAFRNATTNSFMMDHSLQFNTELRAGPFQVAINSSRRGSYNDS